MDGATLLQRVKEQQPGIARIILSGHADRDVLARALSVAHQFLSKPCDVGLLRDIIERVCGLKGLLEDESIRRAIGRIDRLPSVPRVYAELTQAMGRADAGAAQLADIVETDPAMSVKILQIVNSAYFGTAQRTSSIRQAVAYLGVELLRNLALTAHVFGVVDGTEVDGFSLKRLQRHSLRAARLARLFLLNDPKLGEEAFTAGLMHDVGRIVVATSLPEHHREVLRAARETGRPVRIVEREVVGTGHAEIGAYLLGVWGLPFPVVEAVAFHHDPGRLAHGDCRVVAAVHVADALAKEGCVGREEGESQGDDAPDLAFLERAGLATDLARWRAIAAAT
jgi:HD-like signal output (HDOD) protein